MKKLKAGIIGLGVGQKHLLTYDSHPHVEVYKICDWNTKLLKDVAGKYRGVKLTTDADELLRDPDVDVVSVASYDNFHCRQILKAIDYNKHVYVEKPMCLFPEEAKKIRKALKAKRHCHLSSNLTLRSCPRFVRLKDAIGSGEMGTLYFVQADYFWGRPHKLTRGWRKDMDFYSIIHGAAVHMIDLATWLLGALPSEVSGKGNQIATKGSALKYRDFATLLFEFPGGLVAQVSAHGGCAYPHFHALKVFGTKKTFLNTFEGSGWIGSSEPRARIKKIPERYPDKANRGKVLESFIDSLVDKKKKPLVSAEDVFNTMSICFAAEKAVENRCKIKIQYL